MINLRFNFLKVLFSVLLIAISAFSSMAQESELRFPAHVTPLLLDEFGNVNSEDLEARLDGYVQHLQNDPNSSLFVINYSDRNLPLASPIRRKTIIKTYLTKQRGLDSSRLVIVYGGLGGLRTQIYLIPTKPDLATLEIANQPIEVTQTILFDNYNTGEDDMGCCAVDFFHKEIAEASLDELAKYLKEDKKAKAYLISYGQYCTDCEQRAFYSKTGKYLGVRPYIFRDSRTKAVEYLKRNKNYLVQKHDIEPSRILTINGGFRRFRRMETYFVPANGEIPKAKPETFPPHSNKRKSEK